MGKKTQYQIFKEALEKQTKAIAVIHVIVCKDTKDADTAGPLMAFTKEQDAIDAVDHLNKKMIEIRSPHRTYEKQYLSIFNEQFYK
jgi:hypothetical protein